MAAEVVILVTTGSEEEAKKIAAALIDERLAACANIIRSVQSVFRWQGEVEDEPETLMILKSVAAKVEAVTAKVKELHSYDVPEVIALPIIGGAADYLKWVHEETE